MLKKVTITFLLLALLLCVGLFLYGWHLAVDIEQRFTARRWSVPSKVYSDTTLLYPGQRINPDLLKDKLSALGYRKVGHRPAQKGELQISPHAININMQMHNPNCDLSPVIIFVSLIVGLRLTECSCCHIDNYQASAVISDLEFTG